MIISELFSIPPFTILVFTMSYFLVIYFILHNVEVDDQSGVGQGLGKTECDLCFHIFYLSFLFQRVGEIKGEAISSLPNTPVPTDGEPSPSADQGT